MRRLSRLSSQETEEKEYNVLMTFPVYATHTTTIYASSKDEAESLASHQKNDEWNLLECDPNKIVIDGLPSYEVQEVEK